MSGVGNGPLQVLVAGGGVAGLETCLALRDLAGERVKCTLLTPELEFVYRPMAVAEPFGRGRAERVRLDRIQTMSEVLTESQRVAEALGPPLIELAGVEKVYRTGKGSHRALRASTCRCPRERRARAPAAS